MIFCGRYVLPTIGAVDKFAESKFARLILQLQAHTLVDFQLHSMATRRSMRIVLPMPWL